MRKSPVVIVLVKKLDNSYRNKYKKKHTHFLRRSGKKIEKYHRNLRKGIKQTSSLPVGAVSDRGLHWEHKRCLSRRIRLNADESQRMTIALRFHRPLLVPQNTPTIELDVLRSKRNGRKMEYEGYNRGRGHSITSPRVARRHRLFG